MKDYKKSFFWGILRRISVYPHDVMVWRSKLVRLFHHLTLWKFYDKEGCMREINENFLSFQKLNEDLEIIEQSL